MPFKGLFRKPPVVSTTPSGDTVVTDPHGTSAEVCNTRRRLSTVGFEIGYESDGAPPSLNASSMSDPPSISGTVRHISFTSRVGKVPTNPNKVNQDRCWITDIVAAPGVRYSFFGVADGHGVHGHSVAEIVRTQLGLHLEKQVPLHSDLKTAIKSAYQKLNRDIFESYLDASFSGAATVSVLVQKNKLYCANLGDCRCILGSHLGDRWEAIPLSRDHKPDLPDELKRITEMGGRVAPYRSRKGDPMGPARVWLQTKEVPGLAMSRSFGDKVAASVGVSSDPEITERILQPEDKILVLASDGVWEFLSSQAVLDLVTPFYKEGDARGAAELVCQSAENRWKQEEDVVDDITAVILFF